MEREGIDVAFQDMEELQFINIQGVDNVGRRIIRIVGKHLPAPVVDNLRLKDFILHKISREVPEERFCIAYFHTQVTRKDNCPGVFNVRWLYEALPADVKKRLEVVYFVHPGLLSRTILGTLGRFFLSERLYHKLNYISRIEFLWDYMQKGQVEVPDFVFAHDKQLEHRPLMDYWIESDPLNAYGVSDSNPHRTVNWAP
eukprot:c9785_g1_i1 orf=75-671(+)